MFQSKLFDLAMEKLMFNFSLPNLFQNINSTFVTCQEEPDLDIAGLISM
jgi:hypothetical protein